MCNNFIIVLCLIFQTKERSFFNILFLDSDNGTLMLMLTVESFTKLNKGIRRTRKFYKEETKFVIDQVSRPYLTNLVSRLHFAPGRKIRGRVFPLNRTNDDKKA